MAGHPIIAVLCALGGLAAAFSALAAGVGACAWVRLKWFDRAEAWTLADEIRARRRAGLRKAFPGLLPEDRNQSLNFYINLD